MSGKNLNILIIDDDEDDFFIANRYLKKIDQYAIQTTWCNDIEEAVNKLISNKYDLYFLDYKLGHINGIEILEKVIHLGCTKPIILFTGLSRSYDDHYAIKLGAYDYLTKNDLNTEMLERCIRYTLERYKNISNIIENERKYRLIFENASSFIFTTDEAFKFRNFNKVEIFYQPDGTPDDIRDKSFIDLVDPSSQAAILKCIQKKQPIKDLVIQFQGENGEIRLGNLNFEPIASSESNELTYLGIIYDITLRIKADQAKILNERIESTRKLVSILAHEIRNPLTNIKLSAEGLLEETAINADNVYIDIIQRNSNRINQIITELLNCYEKVDLKKENQNIIESIEEVIEIASDRAKLKNIAIAKNISEREINKVIDKEKFKIALTNLCINAIESMDKLDSKLTIQVYNNKDSKTTCIEISDNGIGISEEDIKKIFDPYFTKKKNGLGLGLMSTLNILNSHNAQLDISSKVGEGSLFRIIL